MNLIKVYKTLILALLLFVSGYPLKVLHFNIKEGGTGRANDIIAICRASQAKIISISEAANNAANVRAIADSLDFNQVINTGSYCPAILSYYPILDSFKITNATFAKIGATLCKIAIDADTVWVMNSHLDPNDTRAARNKRRIEVDYYVNWIRTRAHYPTIWAGDFNSIDATEGYLPIDTNKVEYLIPAIKDSLYSLRFRDAYRLIKPSYSDSGYTFISTKKRLDYIFVNKYLSVNSCQVLDSAYYTNWPSDHYAVLSDVTINQAYKTYQPLVITTSATNYVSSGFPSTNNGTNTLLKVYNNGTVKYISYMKFLLAAIDHTKVIDSVCLLIKSEIALTKSKGDAVYLIPTNNWTETGQTYSNADKTFTDSIGKTNDSISSVTIYSIPLNTTNFITKDTCTFAIYPSLVDSAVYLSRNYVQEPPKLFIYYNVPNYNTITIKKTFKNYDRHYRAGFKNF